MAKYTYYQLLINQNPVQKLNSIIPHEHIFYFVCMRQFWGYPFRNYSANQIHLKKIITNYPVAEDHTPLDSLICEQTEIYELFSKQTIQMLISNGYDLSKDEYLVECVIIYKQYDLLKYLFDIGAPTYLNKEFILLVANNDEKEVKNYLNKYILGYFQGIYHAHDLRMGQRIAISNGNLIMCEMLNSMRDRDYCSRISYAAHHNQKTMFEYLVNIHNSHKLCMCNADIKISAVKEKDLPMVKYLFENGADKNYLIELAIKHDSIHVVEWLIENGVDVNVIV